MSSYQYDLTKTFHVLNFFKNKGILAKSFNLNESRESLAQNFNVEFADNSYLYVSDSSASSYWYFLTNLALYLEFNPAYLSICLRSFDAIIRYFDLSPEEIFINDQKCMTRKNSLFKELGSKSYYSHPIYISHIWIENVAPRRVFFIEKIKEAVEYSNNSNHLKILDVGCGMGGSFHLLDDNYQKIGIDISYPMIDICRNIASPNERYEVMNCSEITYPDQSFDLIICFDALEHIFTPKKTLDEMGRLIKSDGLMAIVYPFGSYDWDSHLSLVDKIVFDTWLENFNLSIIEQFVPPGESFPCSLCYLFGTYHHNFS